MFHAKTAEQAERIAAREGLRYGRSVLSPGWFVGTAEELAAIGCNDTFAPGDHPPTNPCPNCGLRHPNGCVDA